MGAQPMGDAMLMTDAPVVDLASYRAPFGLFEIGRAHV